MKTPQNAIDLLQDCVKICNAIYHFNFNTVAEIGQHVGFNHNRLTECFKSTDRGDSREQEPYTWTENGRCGLTPIGREYVEGLIKNNGLDVSSSVANFKEEVLTGLAYEKSPASGFRVSKRSEIKTAALPTCNKHPRSKSPEDYVMEQDMIRKGRDKVAKDIGISLEKLEEAYRRGLVAICPGCGKVELFYSKGKYRRSRCIKCEKK